MGNIREKRGEALPDTELRTIQQAVELRAGGRMRIGGYAAKFDSLSEPLGSFREIVSRGFFAKSAGDGWPSVVARWNHKDEYLLGTTQSGSLRLAIDDAGLDYTVDLLESRSDLYQLVQRGDVSQSSMAFQVWDDTWSYEDEIPLRTLVSGRLIDVAPVNNAAYSQTSVSLRSLADFMDADIRDVERYSQKGELRKFFKRSDAPRRACPPAATREKQLQTLAARWPDAPMVTPLTVRQKQTEVARLAVPPERRSGRSALLEVLALKED